MPHVHALLDRLIEAQRIEVYAYAGERTPEAVCMNPDRPCEYCIFETSRWCLPSEREAKARRDIECEHSRNDISETARTLSAAAGA